MSTIDSLMIQGIRSFDPNSHQVIDFLRPMTVILGHNGCGKTTIIECLKYMATGQYPPGSKGNAFIHDPKVAGETSVQACVKLAFKNVSGQNMVAHRILESKQTKASSEPKLRAVEGALMFEGKDKKLEKMSTRCTELDSQMMIYLGVSKPILSYVIFCHQEDSAWPLSEPKKLKEKFDEIFSATRYIKSIDAIKKVRTGYSTELKVLKERMNHLSEDKKKAHEIRERIVRGKEEIALLETTIASKADDLKPVEEQLTEMRRHADEISAKKTEYAVLKSKIEDLSERIAKDEDALHPVLPDTSQELQQQLEMFESHIETKQATLAKFKTEAEATRSDMGSVEGDIHEVQASLGALRQERKTFERKKAELAETVNELATRLAYTGDTQPSAFHSYLKDQLSQFDKDKSVTKERYRREIQGLEAELEKINSQYSTSKAEQESLSKQEQSLVDEVKGLKQQMAKLKASLSSPEEFEQRRRETASKAGACKDALEDFERNNGLNNIQEEEEQVTRAIKDTNGKIEACRKFALIHNKVTSLEESLASQRKDLDTMLETHKEKIYDIVGEETSPAHFPSKLKAALREKERKVKQATKEIDGTMQLLAQKQASLESKREQAESLTSEYAEWQAEVEHQCAGKPLDAAIADAKGNLDSARQKSDLRPAMAKVYKAVMKKAKADKKCVLCQRPFLNRDELEQCLEAMQEKITTAETSAHADKSHLKTLQDVVDKLSRLHVFQTEKDELPTKIASLEADIAGLEDDVGKLESDKDMLEVNKDDLVQQLAEEKDLLIVCERIANAFSQITRITAQLQKEKSKLPKGHSEDQDALEATLVALNKTREAVYQKKSAVMAEGSKLQEALRLAENEDSAAAHALLQVQRDHDRLDAMKTQKELKMKTYDDKRAQRKALEPKTEHLAEKLDRSRRDVDITRKKQETALDELDRNKNRVQRALERFQAIYKDIADYKKKQVERKLDSAEKSMRGMQEKLSQAKEAMDALALKIKHLEREISSQEESKKNIQANLDLRTLKLDLADIKTERSSLKTQLDELTGVEEDVSIDELEAIRMGIVSEKSELEGKKAHLGESIDRDEHDLESELYLNVDYRHLELGAKIEGITQVDADLQKYARALDNAIVQFHGLKMETVNRTIKEIWQKTYKGNDIDYIEISSEATGKASDSLRRNYQYRVMMVKGNTKLQMRGRCSAGQKVMASIIIRLALADSFCGNCGVLTLDEPTTNLDEENIEALASCLAEIVSERQVKQPHFQLLLITHDEEFLQLLHRRGVGKVYYRISKDQAGHSMIEQETA